MYVYHVPCSLNVGPFIPFRAGGRKTCKNSSSMNSMLSRFYLLFDFSKVWSSFDQPNQTETQNSISAVLSKSTKYPQSPEGPRRPTCPCSSSSQGGIKVGNTETRNDLARPSSLTIVRTLGVSVLPLLLLLVDCVCLVIIDADALSCEPLLLLHADPLESRG
jgi:hypothetical protein